MDNVGSLLLSVVCNVLLEEHNLIGLKEQEQALTAFFGAVSTCWAEQALRAKRDGKPACFCGCDSFLRCCQNLAIIPAKGGKESREWLGDSMYIDGFVCKGNELKIYSY